MAKSQEGNSQPGQNISKDRLVWLPSEDAKGLHSVNSLLHAHISRLASAHLLSAIAALEHDGLGGQGILASEGSREAPSLRWLIVYWALEQN